jgi:radical SAM superfamily enzyme with C-terminal helix-hairpin-helix motif
LQNVCHYARDCWSPTRRVGENANLVIEEKRKTPYYECIISECKTKRTCGIKIVEPANICMETMIGSWSLMKQLEVMSPLWIIQRLSSKEIYDFD